MVIISTNNNRKGRILLSKYVCTICGFVYDEEKGLPEYGIQPGTKWDMIPDSFNCPLCGAEKALFEKVEDENDSPDSQPLKAKTVTPQENYNDMLEKTPKEMSVIFSNLARGCEKQYMAEESKLFKELADYYSAKSDLSCIADCDNLTAKVSEDLNKYITDADNSAQADNDRGAKRALTWCRKVTKINESLLNRYKTEGAKMLLNNKIWVCDICGFIYIGDNPPSVCPVCKVPSLKILEVK